MQEVGSVDGQCVEMRVEEGQSCGWTRWETEGGWRGKLWVEEAGSCGWRTWGTVSGGNWDLWAEDVTILEKL